jgi:hypothetical protein
MPGWSCRGIVPFSGKRNTPIVNAAQSCSLRYSNGGYAPGPGPGSAKQPESEGVGRARRRDDAEVRGRDAVHERHDDAHIGHGRGRAVGQRAEHLLTPVEQPLHRGRAIPNPRCRTSRARHGVHLSRLARAHRGRPSRETGRRHHPPEHPRGAEPGDSARRGVRWPAPAPAHRSTRESREYSTRVARRDLFRNAREFRGIC